MHGLSDRNPEEIRRSCENVCFAGFSNVFAVDSSRYTVITLEAGECQVAMTGVRVFGYLVMVGSRLFLGFM